MNYENTTCPVCGKPLSEGDDVVVCPVCATPQHRECWMANGRCANDDLHSSGYVWKKENYSAEETKTEAYVYENADDVKICHICGSECPGDALHCGNCGALFGQDEKQDKKCAFCGSENADNARHCNQCGAPLGGAFFGGNARVAGTDISADEKIGKNSAGDIATYVQASSHRYIRKFKRIEDGQKLSFNFAAFFFAPYWFFYRKLYKAGAFFLVAFVTASILLSGFTGQISAAVEEYSSKIAYLGGESITEEQMAELEPEIQQYMTELYTQIKKPMLISGAVTLILKLICALVADILYYKKVTEDLKAISETVPDFQVRRLIIARKGGLSALAFMASVFGESMLIYALYSIADFIRGII